MRNLIKLAESERKFSKRVKTIIVVKNINEEKKFNKQLKIYLNR